MMLRRVSATLNGRARIVPTTVENDYQASQTSQEEGQSIQPSENVLGDFAAMSRRTADLDVTAYVSTGWYATRSVVALPLEI